MLINTIASIEASKTGRIPRNSWSSWSICRKISAIQKGIQARPTWYSINLIRCTLVKTCLELIPQHKLPRLLLMSSQEIATVTTTVVPSEITAAKSTKVFCSLPCLPWFTHDPLFLIYPGTGNFHFFSDHHNDGILTILMMGIVRLVVLPSTNLSIRPTRCGTYWTARIGKPWSSGVSPRGWVM